MDPALAELATSGAQTIVRLMVTDAWRGLRGKVARIFTHPGSDIAVIDELETSRYALVSATPADQEIVAQTEQDRWEARIRLGLLDDSAISALIVDLINEAKGTNAIQSGDVGKIKIRAKATGNSRVYQQGYGTQYNK